MRQPDGPDLGSVMGMGEDDVRVRLGEPVSAHAIGGGTWLVYSTEQWRLRVRLSPPGSGERPVVRSCTLELDEGGANLEECLRRVGLGAVGPIDSPGGSGGNLLRCEVRAGGHPASVTADVRDGTIAAITVFDEAPDWSGRPS